MLLADKITTFFKEMAMQGLKGFGHGIYAVDSAYTGPDVAAIHLIEQDGRAALVDTGNNDALVHVEQALAETGLSPEAGDFVLLTHIHLDHAGGAGAFMQAFPNAKLVVHRPDGTCQEVTVTLRIDTPIEVDYYRAGGILPFVLRQLLQG